MAAHYKNGLLATLSAEDRRLLEPHLEPVTLPQGSVLFGPHQAAEHVVFFESGLSSEVSSSPDGQKIEVGCVGREGLSTAFVILGVDRTPHKSFMQVGGTGWRIRADVLQEAMATSRALQTLLLRYVHVFTIQIASTALADGRYNLEQRLARWLLMGHDRLENDELPLTHDFLSLMLGVRRAGVTQAVHVLEGEHLIEAKRSLITIRNRRKLEERASGCYGVPEAEYTRWIAPFGKGSQLVGSA